MVKVGKKMKRRMTKRERVTIRMRGKMMRKKMKGRKIVLVKKIKGIQTREKLNGKKMRRQTKERKKRLKRREIRIRKKKSQQWDDVPKQNLNNAKPSGLFSGKVFWLLMMLAGSIGLTTYCWLQNRKHDQVYELLHDH